MTIGTVYSIQIINQPQQPAVRIGELRNVSKAVVTEILNGKETFRFDLARNDPSNALIVLSQTTLQVVRHGTVVWWGIVTNLDGDGIVNTYTAQDHSWLFTKRWVGPAAKIPFYSTRFQLANTAISNTHAAPVNFSGNSNVNQMRVVDSIATSGFTVASTQSGVNVADNLWKVSLDMDAAVGAANGGDIFYTAGNSAWSGRVFVAYDSGTFGNYPGTVSSSVGSPDIWTINAAAYPINSDYDNVPITPMPGAGNYVTIINWGGTKIDQANSYTGSSALGGRMWRRFVMNNNTTFAKDVHAVAYVRLNGSNFLMDAFSSTFNTMADAQGFNTFDNSTWGVVPPQPVIVKFGLANTNSVPGGPSESSVGLAYSSWNTVTDGLNSIGVPSGQWARLVGTATIPPLSSNVSVAFQFQAATPTGYDIGGVDIFVDDGLFYTQVEQGTIVNDILSLVQNNDTYGWQSLYINTNVAVGSGTTSSTQVKQYLFSDYQTAYDALWEYTTFLKGFDYSWVYTDQYRTFTTWFSPGAPGTTVGTSVGRGTVKPTVLVHGDEIVAYSVTGDGTMLADVVGVYEAATPTITGAARDFASYPVQNAPTRIYNWTGTPNSSASTRVLNGYTATNLVPDPKGAYSPVDMASSDNSATSYASTVSTGGPDATNIPSFYRVTGSGRTSTYIRGYLSPPLANTVINGAALTLSAYIRVNQGANVMLQRFSGGFQNGAITALAANTWTPMNMAYTSNGTTIGVVGFNVVSTTTALVVDSTGWRVSPTANNGDNNVNYFDGDFAGTATALNTSSVRWQFADVYEGTPGGGSLTIQSQALRGYNRYSNLAYTLNLVINPKYTDLIFQHDVGDVVYISIAELGMLNVQFRITGRTTSLDSDTVGLTVQQYYGV